MTIDKGKGTAEDPADIAEREREANEKFRQLESERRHAEELKKNLEFIYPKWTKDQISEVAKAKFTKAWIEPFVDGSIVLNNNYQLDLPLAPKAFLFEAFRILEGAKDATSRMKGCLIAFYAKFAQAQGLVWSCMPINQIVKIERLEQFKDLFVNYGLMVLRGENRQEFRFTLADIPFMNPMDWLNCYRIIKV